MSSSDNNSKTRTDEQFGEIKSETVPNAKTALKSAIKFNNPTPVPKPEPRKKLTCNNNPLVRRSGIEIETTPISDQQEVKLVKIRSRNEDETEDDARKLDGAPRQNLVYCESRGRANFHHEIPEKCLGDEGVGNSPTTNDTDNYEEDDITNDDEDDYYEEFEDFEGSEHQDELTNLSRQSMVPLHELIAYYKYIQQGNRHIPSVNSQVSRQSSKASDESTRSKRAPIDTDAYVAATKNSVIKSGDFAFETNLKAEDLESVEESPQERVEVSQVKSDNAQNQQQEEVAGTIDQAALQFSPAHQASQENRRRVRANVVLELISSERDFVQHLKDVVEGYLYPARKHPEIFSCERINTIFSNIEQLYGFQRKFLETMETCINWDDLALSEVGHCFLEYEKGFSVYHHYCNNHPNAISELQDLYTRPRFVKFFEACRLLQNMIDISLDGFLLTPIQKICKYPLQLNELLKNTDQDHPDYQHVVDALESMRNCANLANERKRRIEALADVMSFQERVENWWGPKLSDTSSILIHSGEVSKMSSHTWSQGIQLHLFDHLLLISKKDLLKRNSLILKARVCMDTVIEIADADEYKPKKSFKLFCGEHRRWYVFTTRSERERDEWINAFERERNLVEADENEGFQITEREIGVARRALQIRKHSRSARYRHKRPDTAIVDQLDLDDANTIMNRTLSLPSCIHPSHVMNFVEDSKIVPNRKKNASPSSSTRSPTSGSIHPNDQESQASGSWFRKMGSKKLSKGQVYSMNGPVGGASGNTSTIKSRTASPTNIVLDTTAKYDQLEKKHRDHMVSEEQARLYRLNNDLPPPVFGSPISKMPSPAMSSSANRNSRASMPHLYRQSDSNPNARHCMSQARHSTISTDPDPQLVTDIRSLSINQEQLSSSPPHSFDTTVVLASGKIVRVREDAV